MITVPDDMNGMPKESAVMRALSTTEPAEPSTPADVVSPVRRVLSGDEGETSRISVAREATAATTPDQAARVLRLEMQTGLPGDFISQDMESIEKMASDRNFSAEEFRKSNPKFAGWVASNPNHFAFAKEDLGFFGRVEKAHQAFSDGIKSVPVQEELSDLINAQMDGTLPAGGEKRIAELDKILADQQRRGNQDDALAYSARQVGYSGRQFLSTAGAGVKGGMMGAPAGAVIGSAVPGLGTLAGWTSGMLAGGLSASWVYSYRMERAFAYKELRNTPDIDGNPMPADVARQVASGVGILNAMIEVGSEVLLARMIPGLSGLFARGKAGVTQQVKSALLKPTVRGAMISGLSKIPGAGIMEGLEEISQAYVGAAGREVGQAVSTGQAFASDSGAQDAKDALSQGLAAFTGTALTFGAGVGGANFVSGLRAARIAERSSQFAQALGEGVDSKAFKNLPEKAQDAVRAIVKDGPLKTAYIDAGAWQEYFQKQGADPREAAIEVLGDAKPYDEAVSTGQEIAVPMENYARKIAVVPEANKFFSDEIRHEPGAMNARESKVFFQKIEEENATFMKSEDEFKAQTAQESGAAVKADILAQLKEAGYDDKTARTMAKLSSGFEALGTRAGVDPLELYKRYNPRIRNAEQAAAAQQTPAQETFMQRAKRVVSEALGITPYENTKTPEPFPRAGETVDNRLVRAKIPNQASIGASLTDYTILPGIREVPVIPGKPKYYSATEQARTLELAEQIKASGEISPLIVVLYKNGDYILEGAHRYDALREIGAKSFPAMVVLDNESLAEKTFSQKDLPYKPMDNLTAEQRQVEEAFARELAKEEAKAKYAALPSTLGGKLLNLDEARHLAEEYAASKEGRTKHTLSTQRPASVFIEQLFAEALAEPGEGHVLFMAGGGGSGKSTYLGMISETAAQSDVILDSVFANLDKSIARIEAALNSGRTVMIAYVHRDIVEAARDGVAGRFDETGRWVPAAVLADDHVNAQETFFALTEHYADHPDVLFKIAENRTGQTPVEITLDNLQELRYTNSEETAVEAVNRLLPAVQEALRYVEQKAREAVAEEAESARKAGEAGSVRENGDERGVEGAGPRSEDGPASDELTLNQGADEGARGRIRIGANRQINIDLLKKANLSTFVHELWHFYFEVMADLAQELGNRPPEERTRGQQSIIDDYEALLKHVGAKDRASVTESMHEQIARLGEAYLMKGQAPSSELRQAFARFKVWMTHIYRDIKALAVDLKPEVAKVFDRLLATEDELARTEAEQNVSPLFGDPKKLLGEKDAERYLDAVAQARTEAEEELSAKVLGEVEREQEAWYKEQRAGVLAEIEKEVNGQPVYRALMALTSRDENAPQLKLDPQTIDAMWTLSEQVKKKLPNGITSRAGGVSPYIVAEMFGFKSGLELLDALAAAEPRRELIERLTDERMSELHGDLMQEAGRMHDEALNAVHNTKRSMLLHRELEILADKYMPSFKGLAYKLARRPPTVMAVRQMAEGMVGDKAIKDINPVVYQRAEAKAGKEALEAMLKGDFDTAFAAKQREFLNHELFRAARAAREDIDKSLERFKKMSRKDEDLVKTRDIDLVNAARAVLASFGIGKKPKEGAVSYLDQMARYDPDMHATVRALVDQAAGVGSYEASSYNDFLYLKDAVDALWDLSKRTKQIMIDGKLLDRSQVMGELENRIGEINTSGERAGYDRALSTWDKAKIGLMGMRASLRRVESWVSAMDSQNMGGVFRRYIWNPISEATSAYRLDRRAYLERYLEIVKAVEKSLARTEIKAGELGYTFKDKAELLGALLHSGNESNLSKLLRGRGWGSVIDMPSGQVLDRSRWDAFITRAQAEGILTKADYDYAQAVWNLLDELKPRAQKAHKEMYGYYFSEVTAKEFETPWGKYKGGYVPASVDNFMAADAAIRSEREQIEGNNSYMFPTTGRGFTKGRMERYAAPLMMDVRFIPGHIDKVLRFIHIEPRVKDVARVIMDREFRKSLDGFDQTVGGDMLIPWLQRTAQQMIETPSQGYGGRAMDTFFRTLRSRTGLNVLFANVANTLQQPFDLSRSFLKVKPRYMRNALWRFIREPAVMAQEIADLSDFMRTRETTKVMEVQRNIDDMMLNPSGYEDVRRFAAQHGYFMQAAMQNQVDTITWAAAYGQATEGGASELEAVRSADSAVRETQGSMSAEDVSKFETGSPFKRAFTMFYSYFNMQANVLGTEFITVAREMGLKKGAGRLLYAYTFGFMIPAMMGDAIVRAMSGDKWDKDDDGYLDDVLLFFLGSQLRTAAAMVPIGGPILLAGFNTFNDKPYDDKISTSPAISMIEASVRAPRDVYEALHDKRKAHKAIRETATLLGLLTGLPFAALGRPIGYLADVGAGVAKPTGPIDFTRGLITGKSGGRK